MKYFALAAVGAACAFAHADVYSWTWQPGDPGGGYSNSGGTFKSVHGRFDSAAQQLTWEIGFADQITDGFTLALNNGPNPKGHAGELALVYFDATDVENVRVSSYAYNGMNTQTSYRDGSPLSGIQSADVIFGVAPIEGAAPSVLHASVTDQDGGRFMRLVLDTTGINTHTPTYPGSGGAEEWYGMGFDTGLGVWLHPVTSLATEYGEDGALSFWSGRQGWLDGANYTAIPTPGVAMAGLVGLGFSTGRRRRSRPA